MVFCAKYNNGFTVPCDNKCKNIFKRDIPEKIKENIFIVGCNSINHSHTNYDFCFVYNKYILWQCLHGRCYNTADTYLVSDRHVLGKLYHKLHHSSKL